MQITRIFSKFGLSDAYHWLLRNAKTSRAYEIEALYGTGDPAKWSFARLKDQDIKIVVVIDHGRTPVQGNWVVVFSKEMLSLRLFDPFMCKDSRNIILGVAVAFE